MESTGSIFQQIDAAIGRLEAAGDSQEGLEASGPDDADAQDELRNKLRNALRTKRYDQAIHASEELGKRQQDRTEACRGLAKVARMACYPTQAVKLLRALQLKAPNDPELLLEFANSLIDLGHQVQAEKLIGQVFSEAPEHLNAIIARGKLAESKGDWPEAKSWWTKAQKQVPTAAFSYRAMTRCHHNLGDLDQAIACQASVFDHAVELPIDHYNFARLSAWKAGQKFTLEESLSLVERFPESSDIAAGHAANLRTSGLRAGAFSFLDAKLKLKLQSERPLLTQLAMSHEASREYAEAKTLFLELHKEDQSLLVLPLNAARCLAQANDYDGALDLLKSIENEEASDAIYRMRSLIHRLAGNETSAILESIAAVRLNGSVQNTGFLCETLLRLGRPSAAVRLTDRLVTEFEQVSDVWRIAGQTAHATKKFPEAAKWFQRYLSAWPEAFHIIDQYSDALWQCGAIEHAWFCKLASVTARPQFVCDDPSVRTRELTELQAQISRSTRTIAKDGNPQRSLDLVALTEHYAPRPQALKSDCALDAECARALQTLAKIEQGQQPFDALLSIKQHLPRVSDQSASASNGGDVMYRAAHLFQKAGQEWEALHHYEKAAWLSKLDPMPVNAYRSVLKQTGSFFKVPGSPNIAVLMVTCEANLERSRQLAGNIRAKAGRSVLTVRADPSLEEFSFTEANHGHELVVPCDDGYLSLPRKLILAYRFLFARTNASGVLKLDDDIVLADGEKFNALLRKCHLDPSGYVGWVSSFANGNYHHGRYRHQTKTLPIASHDPITFCGGGHGYYLSRRSLGILFGSCLSFFRPEQRHAIYEDVFFGEVLSRAGVLPSNADMPVLGGYRTEVFEPDALVSFTTPSPILSEVTRTSDDGTPGLTPEAPNPVLSLN